MVRPAGAALLLALVASCGAQQECSGHGKKDDSGACVCDNPWPAAPTETRGFTGRECEVPVFSGNADGKDMAQPCADQHCGELNADGWVCWAVPLPA